MEKQAAVAAAALTKCSLSLLLASSANLEPYLIQNFGQNHA